MFIIGILPENARRLAAMELESEKKQLDGCIIFMLTTRFEIWFVYTDYTTDVFTKDAHPFEELPFETT